MEKLAQASRCYQRTQDCATGMLPFDQNLAIGTRYKHRHYALRCCASARRSGAHAHVQVTTLWQGSEVWGL